MHLRTLSSFSKVLARRGLQFLMASPATSTSHEGHPSRVVAPPVLSRNSGAEAEGLSRPTSASGISLIFFFPLSTSFCTLVRWGSENDSFSSLRRQLRRVSLLLVALFPRTQPIAKKLKVFNELNSNFSCPSSYFKQIYRFQDIKLKLFYNNQKDQPNWKSS